MPSVADGSYAVDLQHWPGFVTFGRQREGTFLLFNHVALSNADTTESHTSVTAYPDYLQINRSTESPLASSQVTLIQSRQFANANDEPVSLLIKIDPAVPSVPAPPAVRLTAATFSELCRDHPTVVRDSLLPILRDLGAAGVMRSSDLAQAWQVLGAMTPADADMARRVDVLLKRLDGDDFADRTKAEDDLLATGTAGAVELRRRDLSKLPPEPRSVAENVLRRVEPLPAEQADRMGRSVPFLLDTLTLDDPRLTTAAAKRLGDVTGRPIDLPPELPADERERRITAYAATLGAATRPAPPINVP